MMSKAKLGVFLCGYRIFVLNLCGLIGRRRAWRWIMPIHGVFSFGVGVLLITAFYFLAYKRPRGEFNHQIADLGHNAVCLSTNFLLTGLAIQSLRPASKR